VKPAAPPREFTDADRNILESGKIEKLSICDVSAEGQFSAKLHVRDKDV
jgi:hypothetical protein